MPADTSETGLETIIVNYLTQHGGYEKGVSKDYKPTFAIDTDRLKQFLFSTQPQQVQESCIFDNPNNERKFFERLRNQITKKGIAHTLRKGINYSGTTNNTFTLYYPFPSDMNPAAQAQYKKNKFCVIRQLHFSGDRPLDSIDVVIFINGLPVITMELKNQLTHQDAARAVTQYQNDRDPQDLLFKKKRCAVHFAVDDDVVMMCTELNGKKSVFLPFNKGLKDPENPLGVNDGAGNPVNPNGLKTDYLWKEILSKQQFSEIMEHYAQVIKEKDEETGKDKEKVIWPRYHQLDAVKRLLADTEANEVGKRYLIQHSAGSGKSNSITWLAFQLEGMKVGTEDKFDSVLVVTDRVNLDKQIRDNIMAFVDNKSIVGWADSSAKLKAELTGGKKIIITTVHKFPFILESIGTEMGNKHFAIIIDEAHSSQSGTMSADMNRALTGLGISTEGMEDNEDGLNELLQGVIKGKRMAPNANFYAFTATPKPKTLETFGVAYQKEDGEIGHRPFHNYSMKQAIEEGFILDVLKGYTTYQSFYKIKKTCEDDPQFDKKPSQKKLRYWVESRPETVAAKAKIMVGHFLGNVCDKIDGQARAMVVTAGIERAIDYYYTIKQLLEEAHSPYKAMVAFSGDKEYRGETLNEERINGFPSAAIEKTFRHGDYRILVVADKFQTGYDEPLLDAMYVDKPLKDVKTVQTLSRINRRCDGKSGTFVLDFVNDEKDIQAAFQHYYITTILTKETDPNKLTDLIDTIEEHHIYTDEEVADFNLKFWKGKDRTQLDPILDVCVQRFKEIESDDDKITLKSAIKHFVRVYEFLSTVLSYGSVRWQKLSTFYRFLYLKLPKLAKEDFTEGLIESVSYEQYRSQGHNPTDIKLESKIGEVDPISADAVGHTEEPDMENLGTIVDEFNQVFGDIDWGDADLVKQQTNSIIEKVSQDDTLRNSLINSGEDAARQDCNEAVETTLTDVTANSNDLMNRYWQSEEFQSRFNAFVFQKVNELVNPTYDETDLIAKMKAKLEDDFSSLCGVYYRDLQEVLEVFFKVINKDTVPSLDGLNNVLRRTLNFVYRSTGRTEDNRERFSSLINRYEAFLRKLYYLREGHEYVTPAGHVSGLVDIVHQFRSIQGLYNNRDERYHSFKEYYQMVYTWRNEEAHTSPELPEDQLPAAIHVIVAMYVFSTMVSVTDIEENI